MKLNFKQFIYAETYEEIIPLSLRKLPTFLQWLVEAGEPKCPGCGSPMVLRTNSTTRTKFYGCSKYPKCKATKGFQAPQLQPQASIAVQKPVTSNPWTYAKIVGRNFQVPFGKEIATRKFGENWEFIVLDSSFQPNRGIATHQEAMNSFQSFKDKASKSITSMMPSIDDLHRQLDDKLPEADKIIKSEPSSGRPTVEEVRFPPEKMTVFNKKIENRFLNSNDNIMIDALAGTGKTSQLKHLSSFIKPGEKWLYLCFNKKNQVESVNAFPEGVDVKTTHTFLGELLKLNGKSVGGETSLPPREVKWKKVQQILDRLAPVSWPQSVSNYRNRNGEYASPFHWKAKSIINKLVGLAKNSAFDPRKPEILSQLKDLLSKHAIDTDLSTQKINQDRDYTPDILEKVVELMKVTMPGALPNNLGGQEFSNIRDQDDTLWYSAMFADNMNWKTKYSVILLDEVQDFNKCQLVMSRKLKEAGARLIAVGDPFQALYFFRGSDSEAFNELKGIIGGGESEQLPINFRSGGNIIDWVTNNTHVKELKAAPHLQGKGEVYANGGTKPPVGYKEFMSGLQEEYKNGSRFEEDTCFISRTNAPLAAAALQLLKNNISFEIVGKDLSNDLVAHIKRVTWNKPENQRIDDFANKLGNDYNDLQNKWGNKISKQDELKEIESYTDTLISVLHYLNDKNWQETEDSQPMRTAKDFMNFITRKLGGRDENSAEDMAKLKAKDPHSFVTLTTAHKSKGLEWDRVFLMKPDQFNPNNDKNKNAEQKQQELNCMYVSCTRGKKSLYISSDDEP